MSVEEKEALRVLSSVRSSKDFTAVFSSLAGKGVGMRRIDCSYRRTVTRQKVTHTIPYRMVKLDIRNLGIRN